VAESEISYGRPSGVPPTPLPDGANLSALNGGRMEIVFQPDGSVVDASGNPVNAALFFYDNQAPDATAIAVSVLGAGGRVKSWRYSPDASSYVY
jgi:hypothetical protein